MLFAAPLLKLRQKLANQRAKKNHEEEKPFLEHLEDLRDTIVRIVITLAISICICLVFQNRFVDIVMYPIKLAHLDKPLEVNVPESIGEENWKVVRCAARGAAALPPAQSEVFLQEVTGGNELLRHNARALSIWHTMSGVPKESREGIAVKLTATLAESERAPVMEAFRIIAAKEPSFSLEEPPAILSLQFLKPAGSFMNTFKVSMYAAVVVSFPFLFYFLMQFILPGLTAREKKLLWPAISVGVGLFLTGLFFAYFVAVPRALEFFAHYTIETNPNFRDSWTVDDYTSFVCTFCFIFGVGFELPVVVLTMVKLELLTSRTMRSKRAWAIVIITVISAILTPTPDIGTLLVLSGPLVIMYEGCIWIAYFMEKKTARLEAEERARDQARRAAVMEEEPVSPALLPAPGTATAAAEGYSSSRSGDEDDTDRSGPDDSYWKPDPDLPDDDPPPPRGGGDDKDGAPGAAAAAAAPDLSVKPDPFMDGDEEWHEPGKTTVRHPHHEHDELDMEEQMAIYRREHPGLFPAETDAPEIEAPATPAAPEAPSAEVSDGPVFHSAAPETPPPSPGSAAAPESTDSPHSAVSSDNAASGQHVPDSSDPPSAPVSSESTDPDQPAPPAAEERKPSHDDLIP